MNIFDIHTHVGSWDNDIYRNISLSLEELAAELGERSVNKAVVMPSDQKRNMDLLAPLQHKNDPNLFFFPWIDPQEPGVLGLLDNNRDFVKGLKFSSSYDRIKGVTHPLYKPFVEYAADNDLPVLIHCGRWLEMAGYHYALGLARQYPRLRIICAHMGGIEKTLQVAAQDYVQENGLSNVWFDTAGVLDSDSVMRCIQLLGPEKVCFGSDYPLYDIEEGVRIIDNMKIPGSTKKLLLYENAVQLIGI